MMTEPEIFSSVQEISESVWVVGPTIAAAVSTFFAAVAAWISLWQAQEFRNQVKKNELNAQILRTFEHSAAASSMFFDERKKLGQEFGSWYDNVQLTSEYINSIFEDSSDLHSSFNYVLNHFGRMASAYHYDVIDRDVAKELHSYAFVGFWRKFALYLESEFERKPALRELYSHSSELFEIWNEE